MEFQTASERQSIGDLSCSEKKKIYDGDTHFSTSTISHNRSRATTILAKKTTTADRVPSFEVAAQITDRPLNIDLSVFPEDLREHFAHYQMTVITEAIINDTALFALQTTTEIKLPDWIKKMSGNKNKLIAFNYFGGKFTWTDHLYQNFPTGFTHLVDVFAGSLCVSLNYRGNVIRTANEINGEITNFFAQLRNHEDDLLCLLRFTPCSELEYRSCWETSEISDLERARRFYVRARQSFFGLGAQRENKGFHMAKKHVNAQGGETVSRWNNGVEKLHEVAAEIRKNFQIVNGNFLSIIDKLDFPGAFFYCDPPYPLECRNSENDYAFEFSDEQHRQLSERLHRIEGKAMVSGYNCPLMNELYGDWHMVRFPFKRNNIRSNIKNGSGTIMQECIWMNYTPQAQTQKLF